MPTGENERHAEWLYPDSYRAIAVTSYSSGRSAVKKFRKFHILPLTIVVGLATIRNKPVFSDNEGEIRCPIPAIKRTFPQQSGRS
jgi:hypothetical protein